MTRGNTILILGVCLTFFGCTQKPQKDEKDINQVIAEQWQNVDFKQTEYFFYEDRIRYLEDLKSNGKVNPKMTEILIASEYLKKGDYRTSIEKLEELKRRQHKLSREELFRLLRQLALSYMRQAEQENCIKYHQFESCIVPIQNTGFHDLSEGSSKAIENYKQLLSLVKDDYTSIWLMNLAYMTINQYPDSVPEEYLVPLEAFDSDIQIPKFTDRAQLTHTNTKGLSGGVCVDDFNNDGLLDIIASSWGIKDQIEFLINNGDGTFKNVTELSGLEGIYGGLNLNHTDFNNDGLLDFLILRGAWFGDQGKIPNSLLKNNGDGTFTDVTMESGLFSLAPTQTATWADINLDGWIDLFIGNETTTDLVFQNELYLNNGDGTFENIINDSGLADSYGYVKGCSFGDVNNDGFPDLYISYYDRGNRLFLNTSHKNRVSFKDVTKTSFVDQPVISFPTWFWDYDNDGKLDLFVSGYGNGSGKESTTQVMANYFDYEVGGNPRIYKNNGNGNFVDKTQDLGLKDAFFTMGSNFGDLDNDGYLDFYLGTGDPDFTSVFPNRMFLNRKGEEFLDVTTSGRVGHIQKGHGVAFSDLDNDGDQDIFLVVGGAHSGDVFENVLFENPGNENSWIVIQLEGIKSNKSAIGARVKIETLNKDGSESAYYHLVSTGGSFGSASLQIEAGLGEAEKVKLITVDWPHIDKTISHFWDIPVNTRIKIIEGRDSVAYYSVPRLILGKKGHHLAH